MPEPLETRKALKLVTDAVTDLERQVADLIVRDREVTATVRGLQAQAQDSEAKLSAAQRCCREQTEKVNELQPQVRDLTRRLEEEGARAAAAEATANEAADKAAKYEKLAEATATLIEAFDRLPLKAKDGHKIPSDVQQEIELYGTYEWKALADAKLVLQNLV